MYFNLNVPTREFFEQARGMLVLDCENAVMVTHYNKAMMTSVSVSYLNFLGTGCNLSFLLFLGSHGRSIDLRIRNVSWTDGRRAFAGANSSVALFHSKSYGNDPAIYYGNE